METPTATSEAPSTPRPAAVWAALILALGLALGLALALFHVRTLHTYPLHEFDTMQRAGSARALLETGRWSALTLRHWELVGHEHTAEGRLWPVQVWSRGYPLLLAAGFALCPDEDLVAIALPIAAYLGCLALTFLIARRLWGLRRATLALLLLLGHATLAQWSAVGHLESTYALCLLGTLLLVLTREPRWPRLLAAGALLGFAYMIRPTALAWLPLLLVAGVGEKRAGRVAAVSAAGLGLALMLVVNLLLLRSLSPPPLAATGPTISYAEMQLRENTPFTVSTNESLTPAPMSPEQLWRNWPVFAKKALHGAGDLTLNLAQYFPLALLLLAPLGMLLAVREPLPRTLAGAVLATVVLGMAGTLLTAFWSLARYAADWGPFLALFAALGLDWAWKGTRRAAGRTAAAVVAATAALVILGPFLTLTLPLGSVQRPPEGLALGRQVAGLVPPEAIVASPMAVQIAWHGQRRGIVVPYVPAAQVLEMDRRMIRLDALVLEASQFGATGPPETLGEFRKVAEINLPWRRVESVSNYHTWAVYLRPAQGASDRNGT
jgi:hypothetical protein